MAPHLLENTRNRLANGRPAELDPGITMRFLSRPPGLAATPETETRRSLLKSLDSRAAAMQGSSPLAAEGSAEPPADAAPYGSGGERARLFAPQSGEKVARSAG